MSLVAGTRRGEIQIQSAIGAGGMGEVYNAATPASTARPRSRFFRPS